MKLSHLILMIVLICVLTLILARLEGLAGVHASFDMRAYVATIPAFGLALICAWPISRMFRMPPLMIWSGPCPACRQRPAGWWAVASAREELTLRCGACGQQIILSLSGTAPAEAVSSANPTFALRHPKFLGIWRRIDLG